MYTTKIKYYDFKDNMREDELTFALTFKDLIDLNASVPGGIGVYFNKIYNERDNEALKRLVDYLVVMSYGKVDKSGKYFNKSDKIRDKFLQSAVYPHFLQILLNDGKKFGEFLSEIMPKDLKEEIEKNSFEKELLEKSFKNKKTIFDDIDMKKFWDV